MHRVSECVCEWHAAVRMQSRVLTSASEQRLEAAADHLRLGELAFLRLREVAHLYKRYRTMMMKGERGEVWSTRAESTASTRALPLGAERLWLPLGLASTAQTWGLASREAKAASNPGVAPQTTRALSLTCCHIPP